nr:hypothetical protein BaRGS_015553 [Batillaria attramentaria]
MVSRLQKDLGILLHKNSSQGLLQTRPKQFKQLSVTKKQLSVTKKQLSVTKKQLSVTKKQLSVTKKQLSVTKKQLSVTRKTAYDVAMKIRKGFISSVQGGGPSVRVSVGQLLEPLARHLDKGRGQLATLHLTTIQPETFVVDGQVRKQKWSRRDDRSMEAITEYEVLAQQDSMALVELRPLSGVQHQIRAHLAQALNAPILGDHKYSHMDKLAPQRLFPEALQKLGIRQAQVRYLPMHLHAKSLVLPEWRGRNNVFINAVIPKFFLRSLKTLKIKIPKA